MRVPKRIYLLISPSAPRPVDFATDARTDRRDAEEDILLRNSREQRDGLAGDWYVATFERVKESR